MGDDFGKTAIEYAKYPPLKEVIHCNYQLFIVSLMCSVTQAYSSCKIKEMGNKEEV